MNLLISIILIFVSATSFGDEVQERDLSIILDTSLNKRIEMKEPLFSSNWFYQITEKQFKKTDVGYALEIESPLKEWRLISIRIAPCVSLVPSYFFDPETFCWPQIRTVWAPVFDKYRTTWGITVENYSDDRAIHALYWFEENEYSTNQTYQKVKKIIQNEPDKLKFISNAEKKEWLKLRREAIQKLLKNTLTLRTKGASDEKYKNFGIRPELYTDNESFRNRLYTFLLNYTKTNLITELTAFSLPEGRDPTGIDTWVFVAFNGNNGIITPKKLDIYDRDTGKKINDPTFSQTATMNNDDPSLYLGNIQKLREQVLLFNEDRESIRNKVFSNKSLLNGETSCATCHKFNDIKFNFHNFSKLEDRPTTISEKLEHEVRKDLSWLRRNNLR